MKYALEDIHEGILAKNAELVKIKAQNEKIETKFGHLEVAYERIEAKVIRLEKTNIQMKGDFKEHVSRFLCSYIQLLFFAELSKPKNWIFFYLQLTLRVQPMNYFSLLMWFAIKEWNEERAGNESQSTGGESETPGAPDFSSAKRKGVTSCSQSALKWKWQILDE